MLLGLGIVLGVAGIGFLYWLLFLCAVYAAPLFVAAMVCTMLYDHAMMSGAHAILAGIAAGIMVLVQGELPRVYRRVKLSEDEPHGREEENITLFA